MTSAMEIEILMDNGSTKSEAENHLKNGTVVFDDFEENFDKYMEEWKLGFAEGSEDYIEMVERYRNMIKTGNPLTDWGVVKKGGKTYYIMYAM